MNVKTRISYDEFCRRRNELGCRAGSAWCRPQSDEEAVTYTVVVSEFLNNRTYSCRCANAERTAFVGYNTPEARATLFVELLEFPALRNKVLDECAPWQDQPIHSATIVTLHCSGCDRRIVADGVHRLTRLASEGQCIALLNVLELSGRNWPAQTPDFNLVCACRDS